jgi:predicted transcriptional regulator
MARHGKTAKGERNPMAVLNVSIVADMRKVRADTGLYYKDIAERFGVSTMTAFRAITGRSWA